VTQESFGTAKGWVQELESKGPVGLYVTLCGNKTDLDGKREVAREEAEAYAKEVGVNFCETSAKTGSNVTEMFADIVRVWAAQDPLKREAALLLYEATKQDDRPLPKGTRVMVDGRLGHVTGFEQKWVGANVHLIQYDGAEQAIEVRLRGQNHWNVIHS
jgi:hypothetical protein